MTEKVIETKNGWYMKNDKEPVELDDIVGLVKTDEPTDSVQLKKEAQLSICEKRIIELEKENEQLKDALNQRTEQCDKYYEENEQLKADNNRLVNETAKAVAEHQGRVLDLIDKKIAEYTGYYETQIEDQSYHEANAMKECVIALQELKRSF